MSQRPADHETLRLSDVSPATAYRVLRWIYDGNSDDAMGDDGDSALETLVVAQRLMLTDLVDSIEEVMCESADADNAAFLCELAELHGFRRLEHVCRFLMTKSEG